MNPDRKAALVVLVVTTLTIPAEGLIQRAARDPVGILSVCYGDTTDIDPNRLYSVAECRARLDKKMLEALETVERCQPGLPDAVLAAFGDAVYNMGPTIVCSRTGSTAARLLAAGDIAGACGQLPRWNKARIAGVLVELPGLTKRRAAERALCRQGIGGGNG